MSCVYLVPTCRPLTAPDNGDIDCSLGGDVEANPGDTCNFTCDDDHVLRGSTTRICQHNGNWSGTNTTCTRGMVVILFVYLHHTTSTADTYVPPIPVDDNITDLFHLIILNPPW